MSRSSEKSYNSSSSSNKENNNKTRTGVNPDLLEIKSKFDAEFRRFSVDKTTIIRFEDFCKLIEHFHKLVEVPFSVYYTDPSHGDLLPINNDDNFAKAISSAKPLLRLIVQRKGESWEQLNGFGKKKNFFGNLVGLNNLLPIPSHTSPHKNRLSIGLPEDFRQVSAIIDVDILPDTCRRVKLVKHGSEKPLGFYIRDGTNVRVTPQGLEKVPGIFISRLVPGGLAEGTGLLAVNDEVLEVNGIEVTGKTLDQVTDMMVANSSNLIITIRPANERNLPLPVPSGSGSTASSTSKGAAIRGTVYRTSQVSQASGVSQGSGSRNSVLSASDDEEDEIRDHLGNGMGSNSGSGSGRSGGDGGLHEGKNGLHKQPLKSGETAAIVTNHDSDDNPDDVVTL